MMRILYLFLTLLPSLTHAGAWGVGSFENDSALDWVYELETANSVAFLNTTFDRVRNSEYIEVDDCSAALAAADIVASMNSNAFSHLPTDVQAWAKTHSNQLSYELKASAREAVSACTNIDSSELAQLWEESDPAEWSRYIAQLKQRLR